MPHLILITHRWHGDQDVVAVGRREEVCWRDQTSWAVDSEPCVSDLSELVPKLNSSKAPFLPKGRVGIPKRMNFRKHSKRPLTLHFWKTMLQFFSENVRKSPISISKICNVNCWIENDPPFWKFSENSSVLGALPVPYHYQNQPTKEILPLQDICSGKPYWFHPTTNGYFLRSFSYLNIVTSLLQSATLND